MRPLLFIILGVLALGGMAFLDRPPSGFTGGFGEPTCYQCHFDGTLNAPGGTVAVEGLPEAYVPGKTYPLVLRVARKALRNGGFQLTAREQETSAQAGLLTTTDDRTAVTEAKGITYLSHTRIGTATSTPDSIRWAFEWTAPKKAAGPVVFHLVANAGDGDESQFGDTIYTLEIVTPLR